MKNRLSLVLVVAYILCTSISFADDMGTAVQSQAQRSLALMLQNISRPDAARGSVVAAPSKNAPDYFYHWIRDAALVMDSIVEVYKGSSGSMRANLDQTLKDYVTFSRANQLTPNPSGGLGEPKFNADGSAFTLGWCRPQNDGAASRATTLIHYAEILLSAGQSTYVRQVLYDGKVPTSSVIKADLEYVSHNWQNISCDLWEEVGGHHFYTVMVSRRAMVEGAKLAQSLGDGAAASFYNQQAQAMTQAIGQFWDPNRKIIVETLGQVSGPGKSGLDAGVILGALHGEAGDGFLAPSSDAVMSTAMTLIQTFQSIYPINQGSKTAPAIGRYPEDVYDGIGRSQGNPWFLITLAYSELCNRIRVEFSHIGTIKVSALNAPFLNFVLQGHGTVQPGTVIARNNPLFNTVIAGLGQMGDQFFATVLLHRASDGSMSEEFSRQSGYMVGAPNLSWSHAAFITAALWRQAR